MPNCFSPCQTQIQYLLQKVQQTPVVSRALEVVLLYEITQKTFLLSKQTEIEERERERAKREKGSIEEESDQREKTKKRGLLNFLIQNRLARNLTRVN